jgi:hypothetical protein
VSVRFALRQTESLVAVGETGGIAAGNGAIIASYFPTASPTPTWAHCHGGGR